jgi:surfactin synthase thioesterase subunit
MQRSSYVSVGQGCGAGLAAARFDSLRNLSQGPFFWFAVKSPCRHAHQTRPLGLHKVAELALNLVQTIFPSP